MLLSLSVISASSAEAQFGKRLKDAVKRTAEDKAIQKATEEEGKAIDSALSGGEAARPEPDSTAPGEGASGQPAGAATVDPAAGDAATGDAAEPSAASPADKKVWANYDFVPGQRVLFFSDFTADQVGNFPERLEFKSGSMEVVEFEGGQRAIKASSESEFLIPLPEALPGKFTIELDLRDDEENAVYVTRIRVAESQKTIYDALSTTGRWTTQGILFDTGKSEIKPESTPTLKQIAATLKEHPDLKVEVQGHTDNVGKADANLKLSQARADAVKAALTKEYGVGEGQLTAKGYGDTKPAVDNKTPEGRANNRRVELVKS